MDNATCRSPARSTCWSWKSPVSPDSAIQYAYDDLSRVTQERQRFGSQDARTLHYAYDRTGNATQLPCYGVRVIKQRFDAANLGSTVGCLPA